MERWNNTPRKTKKRKLDVEQEFDSIKVYCRLKPLKPTEKSCIEVVSNSTVQLSLPDKPEKEFVFKKIFTDSSSQQEIFDEIALPLVRGLVNGENGLIFTYGVTGGGKTYTMTGVKNNIGIMPRCLNVLFNSISAQAGYLAAPLVFKPDNSNNFNVQTHAKAKCEKAERDRLKDNNKKTKFANSVDDLSSASYNDGTTVEVKDKDDSLFAVFVTYVEVYNDSVYDLLDESKNFSKPQPQSKMIREDANGKTYVIGATEIEIQSTEEAIEIFYYGNKKKHIASTILNDDSSRGHSIFTIRVVQAPLEEDGEEVNPDKSKICIGQLSLVDLAGTERANRTNNVGDRLTEACKINSSLMKLRNCLETLWYNQKSHNKKLVPYRDTKITNLLKHFFDEDGSIRMIACVNPCVENANENSFALQFAEMSQGISIQCTPKKIRTFCTPARKKPTNLLPLLEENEVIVNDSKPFPSREQFTSEKEFYEATINWFKESADRRQLLESNLRIKSSEFRETLTEVSNELEVHKQGSNEPTSAQIEIKKVRAENETLIKKYVLLETEYKKLKLEREQDNLIPKASKRKAPDDDEE